MKKKLGALIGLATCVTIGGVYATWSYADTTDIVDVSTNIQFSIPSAELSGTFGTYQVTSNVAITIDEETAGSYKTALYYTDTTTKAPAVDTDVAISIDFTLNNLSTMEQRETAVVSYFYFAMGDNTAVFADMNDQGEYLNESGTVVATLEEAKKVDIFTFDYTSTSKQTIGLYTGETTEKGRWRTKDGMTFSYDITFAELKQIISIDAFILDTKAEHDAFAKVLNTAKMNFIVTDQA